MTERSRQGQYGFGYHITAPTGLINDPNGLVYFKGEYHVFFQWNPVEPTHSTKHWGHLTSKDMVHWKRLPVALESNDWFDKNGVYSGSAIVKEDELWLFYTGNVKDEHNVRSSYQCLAVSKDGIHFEKRGPLFEHPQEYTAHVRDPKVWYDERLGCYWMVLGAQRLDETGDAILYRSLDLLEWELVGSAVENWRQLGYMWECPDIVHLGEKDALVYSPQGLEPVGDSFHNIFQTVYQLGEFTIEGKFVEDTKELVELDAGFEYYAPQTFVAPDGRVVQYAWMGTMPPEMEEKMPTTQEGWIHALTIPRELQYRHNQLIQKPVVELQQLRGDKQEYSIQGETNIPLSSFQQECMLKWEQPVTQDVTIVLRDEVEIRYEAAQQRLVVERTNWATGKRETRARVLTNPLFQLQLFIEASSIEIFVNDGEEVFSLRYFVSQETNNQLHFKQSDVAKLICWNLESEQFLEG